MKYIEVDSIKLAYTEKNKEGAYTIFFIHGNSCSSRIWYKQFQDPILSRYRLVAFDLPGHGHSSAPENANNYSLLYFGEVIAKAVTALAANKEYILAGFSLGANVVAEMMDHALHPKGIVLISPTVVGGDCTLNHTLKAGADTTILFSDDPTAEEINRYVNETLLSDDQKDFAICVEDFNSVKKPFRSMILKTSVEGRLNNEIMTLIQSAVPLFVIFGNEDKFINRDYLDDAKLPLWNSKIYKLGSGGHFLNLDQPKIFNDLLASYCRQILNEPMPESGIQKV